MDAHAIAHARRYTSGMNADLLAAALKLNPSDRRQLIEALWDTLSDEDVPVTAEERALLDARLADLETNPGDQSTWSEVKARLAQRRRRLKIILPSTPADARRPLKSAIRDNNPDVATIWGRDPGEE